MLVMSHALIDKHPARTPGGVAELLTIALPMVVSQACETLMMFTDRLFLSHLGPQYMSASMGGGVTCFMFMTFFLGLTGYSNALVAQHLGAAQPRRCGAIAAQAILLALASWPVVLLCIPLGYLLFSASGLAPEQLAPQREFYTILMCGAVIGLVRNALASFFSGIGRTRIVMLSSAVALVVNAGLNYVLIFGKFGFPAMGIRGSAIGTLSGSLAALLILSVKYLSPSIRHSYGVISGFRYERELMLKLLRFGSPSGLEFLLNLMAFNLMVLTFHPYGLAAATAMTITFNWDLVSFIPLVGVGIGVTSLVGRYMGAGEPDTAHRAAMSGVKVATAYSCCTFTAFCLIPTLMVGLFNRPENNPVYADVNVLAIFMVRVMVLYLYADAMAIVFSSALRGAGDTFWTMVLGVSGHWASALAMVVLVRVVHVGPRVAWCMVVVMVFVLATIFFLRYRSGAWRKVRVVEPELQPAVA